MKIINLKAGLLVSVLLFCGLIQAQDKLYSNEFPISDVTLLDGPFKHARDLNIEVLLKYNVDRLLAPYRKEAGLPEKAKSYPNWDGLDGHIAGHYLSSMAMNFAATGNKECKKRMDYMITELKECQEANAINNAEWGVGYAGGFPNSNKLWSAFKKGSFSIYNSAWAPFYNLHKMYAGLRDAWIYCGNEEAKVLFLKFCDWGISVTSDLNDEQMQSVLNVEHGGMNEIFADAFQISGNEKYLIAAKRYSHKMFLEPLSQGIDNLDNKHANTQIPKFIGFERIAELSHDEKYGKAGSFFWETVTANRSLAFGGNSRREHFPGKASCIDFINDIDGPESCNSYNMLKLTEDLFRVNPSAKYADYYERTIFNHILSTQHPEHGGYVYFTPARPRHYRVYSAPNEAMWCCVGTGMENHGKYNQFIYTHSGDSLFLNLFIASELNWKNRNVSIKQETGFPYEERTKLTVTKGSSRFALMVRYPKWVTKGALKISVNGKEVSYSALPASYICINRKWKKGDVVVVELPMHNTIERLPNVPDYIAFMHGPILLGAKTGTEDLKGLIADDGRWAQYAGGKMLPVNEAPILIEDDIQNIADKLVPVKDEPLNFTLNVKMENPIDVKLEPFSRIHDARYMIYWLALTNNGYQSYMDSLATIEKEKIALEKRTIDFVATGEQQPETDHAMQKENSNSGNTNQEFYRDARDGGYFSYEMKTNSETDLSLFVRYWGAEWGGRKFDIYIDDKKLLTEDNTGRWNQSRFQDTEYSIPNQMVNGRNSIRVKFQALPGNTAGAVYYLRLVRKKVFPFHKYAKTPPLGWNSWDIFGTTVTEQQVKEQADAMAKHLLPSGYKYLTVDIQWYEPEATRHDYNPNALLTMDDYGRLTPGLKKFPSAAGDKGFKPLADYVHSKGLKFGIHIMRGIPRQAVEKNLPVPGTTVRAQDIALKNSTCPWNPDMYGVDATKPEGQAYYNSIIQMYADWGVDYIKVDDISRPYGDVQKAEIEAIREAIDKTGRPIVLSLSPGATPVSMGEHVMSHANLWRITDDFWDSWGLLLAMFERLDVWTPYRGPGHFPDADMLPIGVIDFNRPTKFTKDEQYTLMSLWAIGRSPLIFGGDMTKLDDFTKEMLTNPEMLKVDQESENNRQVSRDKNLIVWTADVPNSPDKYIALFNAQSTIDYPDAGTVKVDFNSIGIKENARVIDLWSRKELGVFNKEFSRDIPQHGAGLYRISPVR